MADTDIILDVAMAAQNQVDIRKNEASLRTVMTRRRQLEAYLELVAETTNNMNNAGAETETNVNDVINMNDEFPEANENMNEFAEADGNMNEFEADPEDGTPVIGTCTENDSRSTPSSPSSTSSTRDEEPTHSTKAHTTSTSSSGASTKKTRKNAAVESSDDICVHIGELDEMVATEPASAVAARKALVKIKKVEKGLVALLACRLRLQVHLEFIAQRKALDEDIAESDRKSHRRSGRVANAQAWAHRRYARTISACFGRPYPRSILATI